MRRTVYEPEHEQFREVVREFLAREVAPHAQAWEKAGIVDRLVYQSAGKHGVIGFNVPEEFGGGGVDDFRFNAVVAEELAKAGPGTPAFTLHSDIVAPYLTSLSTQQQKQRWLPGFAAGELIGAIAMSEPGAGSDLAGIRTRAEADGDTWVLSGGKTFVSSGINSDLVLVVARTSASPTRGHRAFSLLVVERGMPGFTRGRNLAKVGLKSQDTAELFFDDVRVPAANVLGEVGRGFYQLMHNLPAERMSIGSFQHNRFVLAELDTELDIAQVFVDRCLEAVVAGELSAVEAAKAKWWTTELQKRVVDACVQLHGGYGYMLEFPVARAYLDARVQTIYGGTTEIMKEIVGRNLGV